MRTLAVAQTECSPAGREPVATRGNQETRQVVVSTATETSPDATGSRAHAGLRGLAW